MSPKAAAIRQSREASAGKSIDEYPLRLFDVHMAEIFGISVKRVHALDDQGEFLRFKNVPTIGRKSWSRDRVKAYLAGEHQKVRLQKAG